MLVESLQRELETRGSPSDRLPTLSVLHANAGTVDALSSCSDSPILYVHLVGLYRTFASNVGNLLSFLTASHGSCWFIVLLTTSASDATDTWWSRSSNPPPRLDGDEISLSLQACATRLGGRLAYAIVRRSFDPHADSANPEQVHTLTGCILQSWFACAMLARLASSHHGLTTRPSDLIMHSRPDALYTAPIDYAAAHRLTSSTGTDSTAAGEVGAGEFLLLLRHYEQPKDSVFGLDPTEVTFFITRSLMEGMCPWAAAFAGSVQPAPVYATASPIALARQLPRSEAATPQQLGMAAERRARCFRPMRSAGACGTASTAFMQLLVRLPSEERPGATLAFIPMGWGVQLVTILPPYPLTSWSSARTHIPLRVCSIAHSCALSFLTLSWWPRLTAMYPPPCVPSCTCFCALYFVMTHSAPHRRQCTSARYQRPRPPLSDQQDLKQPRSSQQEEACEHCRVPSLRVGRRVSP